GTSAVGQNQVAVRFIGIGAHCFLLDQHVANPNGVCILALQCTLVQHVGLAVGHSVVNEQAVLKVLAGVSEVHAVQLDLRTCAGEASRWVHAHQVATEGDCDVLERTASGNQCLLRGSMNSVILPGLQRNHGQTGVGLNVEFDVLCQHCRAHVVKDHGSFGVFLGDNDNVLCCSSQRLTGDA